MTIGASPLAQTRPAAPPPGALTGATWRRGRSRQGLDRRIELAVPMAGVVAVRAVAAPSGPYLVFDDAGWAAFLRPPSTDQPASTDGPASTGQDAAVSP